MNWIKNLQLTLFAALASSAYAQNQPNIVFIFADDWGWGDLSCHGSLVVETPNLDRLAARGTDFYQFSSNSPDCSPSRTAIFTGHYPARYAIHQHFSSVGHHIRSNMPDWLDPTLPHLPKVLQSQGYQTGHFGKWHLSNSEITDAPLPQEYGFDTAALFNGIGSYLSPENTCSAAMDFITKNQNHPFYVNIWIHETNTPHFPKEKYLAKYSHLSEQQRVYSAVVAEADAAIGQVIQLIEDLGLSENTLIIFSSDNGPEDIGSGIKYSGNSGTGAGLGRYYSVGSSGPLKGSKRSLYQGGIGVPFIVSWPGTIPMGRIDKKNTITSLDLYPTLIHIGQAKIPKGHTPDGINIMPAFMGKTIKRKLPIFWEWNAASSNHIYNWPQISIRKGKWKLVSNERGNKLELYNLKKSAVEKKNLAGIKKMKTQKMLALTRKWKASLPQEPDPICFSLLRKQYIGH